MPRPKLLIATGNPGKMREYRRLLRGVPFELVSLGDLGVSEEVEETGLTFAENASLKARFYSAIGGLLTLADDSGLEVDALCGEPGVRSARYGEESPPTPLCKGGEPGGSPETGPGDGPDANREEEMSDRDRVGLLLRNLKDVPWERRTARFRCVIAIATPPGPPFARGGIEGAARGGIEGGTRGLTEWLTEGLTGGLTRGETEGLTLVAGVVEGMIQYKPLGSGGFGYDPVFYLPSYSLTMAQIPLKEKNRISHRAGAAGKAVKVLKQAAGGRSGPES